MLILADPLAVLLTVGMAFWMGRVGVKPQESVRHERGARVRSSGATPMAGAVSLTLAGVPLALLDETKHFKMMVPPGPVRVPRSMSC